MFQQWLRGLHGGLNHDFCPWMNRYVYWLKRPIGWVVLAFAMSLLLGIYVSHQAFLASGAIAAIGVLGCAWPWLSTLGLRGELHWGPNRCEEGDAIESTLTIVNRWPFPVWGLVVDVDSDLNSATATQPLNVSLSKIPALSRTSFRWHAAPKSRGVYPRRPPRLSTAFPFGIWSCHQPLEVREPLIVWPRMTRLTDVPPNQGDRQLGVGGSTDRAGADGDWIGVRPFRPGDRLRHVHWAQTARRDHLIVFEHQSLSKQTIAISLDENAARAATAEQVDCMVRVLASLATHFLAHAWEVRIALDGAWRPLLPHQKHAWLDELAQWQPGEDVRDQRLASVSRRSVPSMNRSSQASGWSMRITAQSALVATPRQSIEATDRVDWTWCVGADSPRAQGEPIGRGFSVLPASESLDATLPNVWRQVCAITPTDSVRCAS